MAIHEGALGRRVSKDFEHIEKYPLRVADVREITTPRPIVIGVNWYSNFDNPVKDSAGNYWIGRDPTRLGSIRGGHCVCLKPYEVPRLAGAWDLYNQGSEGACVGFGCSMMLSTFNKRFYFARWLWDRAKEIDYWSDTNPGDDEGTSVKAGLDIMRTKGHVPWTSSYTYMNTDGEGSDWRERARLTATYAEGIAANRWITSMEDCFSVLGHPRRDYAIIWNSWGRDYPRGVRIPYATLERLWREDGEFGVPTDK